MNNTRRRESGHSRRWPMVSICFRASSRHSTDPDGVAGSRALDFTPGLFARRNVPLSLLLTCIMNVCHIRQLISVYRRCRHAEMFAATPARLRYRFPMLAQLSLPPSLPSSRPLARSASLRLDGVKCAPSPTRAADFSSYVYQLPSVMHIVKWIILTFVRACGYFIEANKKKLFLSSLYDDFFI